MLPTPAGLDELFRQKHGPHCGWGPRLRAGFGYFTPDDIYESCVSRLVGRETEWLDVGGGRDLFPDNHTTARILAGRCRRLVGIDPSDNILENPYVHQAVKGTIEEFRPPARFDLATLRMVAEHLVNPRAVVESLARLVKPGGVVIVYTVNKWSLVTALSSVTPLRMHRILKRWLWRSEDRDTFEVVYRMNTRKDLKTLFEGAGFREKAFLYLDDCRTFARWRLASRLELWLWKALRTVGLRYPETCLLGIYELAPNPTRSGPRIRPDTVTSI